MGRTNQAKDDFVLSFKVQKGIVISTRFRTSKWTIFEWRYILGLNLKIPDTSFSSTRSRLLLPLFV